MTKVILHTPDATEATGGTETQSATGALQAKIVKDGKVFELQEFGGQAKGFNFYTIQFTKMEDAVNKYGPDCILALINRQLNFAMRNKANNSLPKEDDARNKQKAKGDTLLISVDEADSYVPGERDVTSVSGLTKRIAELKEEIKAAREAGNNELADNLKEQAKVLVTKLQEQIYSGLEEAA